MATFANYIPTIQPVGDSTTSGTGATARGAWREGLYNSGVTAGIPQRFRFVGSAVTQPGGLTINPNHEGHSGFVIQPGAGSSLNDTTAAQAQPWNPDIWILFGGTNDLDPAVGNHTPATVSGYLSTWLDTAHTLFSKNSQQIVVFTVLKRLDATDAQVQTYNALIPGIIAGKSYSSRIRLVDIYASIPNPQIGVNMNDAVHPNDTGYDALAAGIWASAAFQAALINARPALITP